MIEKKVLEDQEKKQASEVKDLLDSIGLKAPEIESAAEVLIIDDSATFLKVLYAIFVNAKIKVIVARNGLDGINKIYAHPDLKVVFCDHFMPVMNGLEMAERLHADSAAPHVPIFMLSTESRAKYIKRALALGIAGWIIKPANAQTILTAARKYLDIKDTLETETP